MRYVSGSTGHYMYFVAFSTSDHVTRVNNLSAFTCVWSRNGTTGDTITGAAVTNANSTSMTGVYKLKLDDSTMMTIGSGNDSEEVCVHITSSMDPVTRTFELYRPKISTGVTLVVDSSGAGNADVKEFGGTTVTGRDIGASVLLSSGTGAGQIVLTSGNPTVLISTGTGAGQLQITSGAVPVSSLGTNAKADVNAEVVDALNVDTYAEPAQGTPGATVTLAAKIGFLYKAWRNRHTQTATDYALYNDDAATVDHKATVSDNGTTFDRTEITSGP